MATIRFLSQDMDKTVTCDASEGARPTAAPFFVMSARESKWERRVDAVLGIAASLILFLMMLLTFVDVVARYLFNFPLRGGFEITELRNSYLSGPRPMTYTYEGRAV